MFGVPGDLGHVSMVVKAGYHGSNLTQPCDVPTTPLQTKQYRCKLGKVMNSFHYI